MQLIYVVLPALQAASVFAQIENANCKWYGTALFCAPQECNLEEDGKRKVRLRESGCGNGYCCQTGMKFCCCESSNADSIRWCANTDMDKPFGWCPSPVQLFYSYASPEQWPWCFQDSCPGDIEDITEEGFDHSQNVPM
ncbi:hypothetical protein FE257_000355 [Aspergillus nanangensis]|uniref:Uncharacterized protein n=1 Tax=Aspergillus nanangensis TaxID=2582783 RepID=A0AAD4CZQ0_ASPNN|nr:hypothetical protein FE257_000355 [Aspergillus nanangensis]